MRFRRKKDDTVRKDVAASVKGNGWYRVAGNRAPATLIEDDTAKRVDVGKREREQSWPENPNPRYRPTRSIDRPHRPGSLNPRPTPSRRHSGPKPPEHGRHPQAQPHRHPPSTTTSTSSTSRKPKRSGEHSMTRSETRGARSSGRGPSIVRAGTTTKECRASSLRRAPTRTNAARWYVVGPFLALLGTHASRLC